MWDQWLQSFTVIFNQSLQELSIFLPRIVAAIIVLLIGAAIARAFKRVVVKVLETLKVSSLVENTPVEHFLKGAEVRHKVEEVVGTLVYWLLMLIVVQTAVSILGLASLSQILESVLNYVPRVISAIVVLFFGVLLAGLVESLIKGAIRTIDGKSARLLGKVSSYLVVTIATMAAVSELGIASDFIMILFMGFVATVSLGFGLALGLGGKEVVSKVLDKWYQQTMRDISE